MQTRRQFLGAVAAPAAALAIDPARAADVLRALDRCGPDLRPPDEVARDESFWAEIARAFTVDRGIVNLNNGGVSPSPRFAQEAMSTRAELKKLSPGSSSAPIRFLRK